MHDGESHLYQDGRFLFIGKKLGICLLCAEKDFVYSVGALGPNSRFCKKCIQREGPRNLRRDANHALQKAVKKVEMVKSAWDEMQSRYIARFGSPLKLHRG